MKSQKPPGRRGLVRILLGLVLIGAAVWMIAGNMRQSGKAGEQSSRVFSALDQLISSNEETGYVDTDPDPTLTGMPVKEIDGYFYIGELEIPGLGLYLPVMEEWDYKRLDIAPCRYSGTYFTDDLVICGHNYSSHFSPIKWINNGEKVYFKTVLGDVYSYEVTSRETVQPTDVKYMIDSEADWDLTLFTCTTSGLARCAVRCSRTDRETGNKNITSDSKALPDDKASSKSSPSK